MQAIRSVTAFLEQTPWPVASAVRHAMKPSDGRFDETMEPAAVRVSTTGLASGRHVVFVQGIDASGTPGTRQAVYFTVQ